MRPSLIAACSVLLLMASPVWAQLPPEQPADAPPGTSGTRVIMDAVFWALPGAVDETCIQLPPGHLTITLHLEDVGPAQPVRYQFAPYWYRAADSPAEITSSVTRDPRTFEATLAGGRYCYAIVNEAEAHLNAVDDESAAQAQLVSVRMTLAPE